MTVPVEQPQPVPPPAAPPVPATFQPQVATSPAPAAPTLPQLADQQPAAQIPEGGYASRIVRIPLPRFHLQGVPEPWVEMRNPGMMAPEALDKIGQGLAGVALDENGEPSEKDATVILATMVSLLRRWCMWDATSEDDVPPLLPEIPTTELFQKSPVGVIHDIGAAFQELQNPQ